MNKQRTDSSREINPFACLAEEPEDKIADKDGAPPGGAKINPKQDPAPNAEITKAEAMIRELKGVETVFPCRAIFSLAGKGYFFRSIDESVAEYLTRYQTAIADAMVKAAEDELEIYEPKCREFWKKLFELKPNEVIPICNCGSYREEFEWLCDRYPDVLAAAKFLLATAGNRGAFVGWYTMNAETPSVWTRASLEESALIKLGQMGYELVSERKKAAGRLKLNDGSFITISAWIGDVVYVDNQPWAVILIKNRQWRFGVRDHEKFVIALLAHIRGVSRGLLVEQKDGDAVITKLTTQEIGKSLRELSQSVTLVKSITKISSLMAKPHSSESINFAFDYL